MYVPSPLQIVQTANTLVILLERMAWRIVPLDGRPMVAHVRDPQQRAMVERTFDRFESRALPVLPGLRAQVVHNDMSLDNVLVDDHGRITGITDFSIPVINEEARVAVSPSRSKK